MSTQAELFVSRAANRLVSEETVNSITHGIGFLLVLLGAIPLALTVAPSGKATLAAGCLVYLCSLAGVYAASTLSHAIQHENWNRRLRIWDQGLIYLMIAGTYTPFLVANLDIGRCRSVLFAVWTIAFIGFFSKILLSHRIDAVAVINYILLGWVPAMTTISLVPRSCITWLVIGGVCYTIGTIFLKYDHTVRYFHAVWHMFVIAGTASHFYAVIHYLSLQTA